MSQKETSEQQKRIKEESSKELKRIDASLNFIIAKLSETSSLSEASYLRKARKEILKALRGL